MEDTDQPSLSYLQKIESGITGIIVGILALIVIGGFLHFFGLVKIPFFFFLPSLEQKKPASKVVYPQSCVSPTPQADSSLFTPKLNAAEAHGPLVDSVSVIYTLVGKITKVSASQARTYDIELVSNDGLQKSTLTGLEADLVRSTTGQKKLSFEDVQPGDDALVTVAVTQDKNEAPLIRVSQIAVSSR